jgi:hypothetical protein
LVSENKKRAIKKKQLMAGFWDRKNILKRNIIYACIKSVLIANSSYLKLTLI